jgi:hypothetical protein
MFNSQKLFTIHHPDLCPALRWKGQFVLAEKDQTIPDTSDHMYWCMHTQTPIGPDGELAEPAHCCHLDRGCHES